MAQCDNGYKLMFPHPEMVRDLLTSFVHEPWVAELGFTTLVLDANRLHDEAWALEQGALKSLRREIGGSAKITQTYHRGTIQKRVGLQWQSAC